MNDRGAGRDAPRIEVWPRAAAVAAGVSWLLARALIEWSTRDPAGAPMSYDAANRVATVAIVLLGLAVVGAVWRTGGHPTGRAKAALGVTVAGFVALLAGNIVEFWGVLLQDRPNAFSAAEGEDVWIGSQIGWMAFGVGMLLVVVGTVWLARSAALGSDPPTWWTLTLGGTGIAVLVSWIGGVPGVVAAVLLAAGWLAVGATARVPGRGRLLDPA